jgi:hypothetical protein
MQGQRIQPHTQVPGAIAIVARDEQGRLTTGESALLLGALVTLMLSLASFMTL